MQTPGNARDDIVTALVTAYFDLVTDAAGADDARELSISVAMIADSDRFFPVGRAVRDAFPWVPFLRRLRTIAPELRTARSETAQRRLYSIATGMLTTQGLQPIRPEDLLARPSAFEEAAGVAA